MFHNNDLPAVLRYHLGKPTEYSIPEAELVGEVMAAHLLEKTDAQVLVATIGADNTSTIQNTKNQKPRGADYLLYQIHDVDRALLEVSRRPRIQRQRMARPERRTKSGRDGMNDGGKGGEYRGSDPTQALSPCIFFHRGFLEFLSALAGTT